MSDRVRVALIFAVIALIAGGGGFYFFAVYQPAQDLKAAQEEIAAWEARYQDARACLLGKTPGSARTSEALAIRELAPDPWDRGRCTPLISKLNRGPANDTGVEPVEAAWVEVEGAAKEAALAFAKHVSSTPLDDDPLPDALDALDAARGKLRAAAKLPATTETGTPLAPAEVVALVDGKEPVTDLETFGLPSAGGILTFGRTASRQVQIVLAAGGAPRIVRVGHGAMRALPDLSWGATPGMLTVRGAGKGQDSIGEVLAGAMDAEGAIAAPQKLELAVPLPKTGHAFDEVPVLAPGDRVGSIMLAAVAGTLADGALVYGGHQRLVVSRAKDGAIAAGTPVDIDIATAATDLDGRVAVVWTTTRKLHQARLIGPSTDSTFELPDSFQGDPCMTKDRIWLMGNSDEVFAFGGGRPLVRNPVPPASRLIGCTRDAAIVLTHSEPREVLICTDQCRQAMLPPGAPTSSAITEIGGKLRAVAAHAGVVGVWSEDKPPAFYALPTQVRPLRERTRPTMAVSNGKAIDVLARDGGAYVVIRVPAP